MFFVDIHIYVRTYKHKLTYCCRVLLLLVLLFQNCIGEKGGNEGITTCFLLTYIYVHTYVQTQTDVTKRITLLCIHAQGNNAMIWAYMASGTIYTHGYSLTCIVTVKVCFKLQTNTSNFYTKKSSDILVCIDQLQ